MSVYTQIPFRSKTLTILSLKDTSMRVNNNGEGSIKFRIERLVDNHYPEDAIFLDIGTNEKARIKHVSYYLGSVQGSIPISMEEVTGMVMRYGPVNVWVEIHFVLED